jgi:arginyl-tRNA synthetase
MHVLGELRRRFAAALTGLVDDPREALDLIRPAQDSRFGDYQANFAMSLAKALKRPPREVAAEVVSRLDVADFCLPPEVAGPGFINLRLRDDWLGRQLASIAADDRLGVPRCDPPRTFVVDYSGPNVAKPMHVGHIRSTVIGDALCRTLRFLHGDKHVVGDNHIGDWGTQFGMILWGYKHLRDDAAYRASPVAELARLYRKVNRLVDYFEMRAALPKCEERVAQCQRQASDARTRESTADPKEAKEAGKARKRAEATLADEQTALAGTQAKFATIDHDPTLAALIRQHPTIGDEVLRETVRLHEGDPENVRLWREFMPACLEDIERIYRRLGVTFDATLGESFYHDRLAAVVEDLLRRGIARETDGATGVFLADDKPPFLIRKRDGAFLYGTTDLATIQYRMEIWHPDAILYVVDHRQSEHFDNLFSTARKWGYADVALEHVSFGTVLGDDGRPFKTRSGDTVGLEGLLDEAVARALEVVSQNDEAKPGGRELSDDERKQIAKTVGIGALKYADLSQNRTSDYVFSYDKMLAMNGNTATYMQYAYARVRSILQRGGIDAVALRAASARITITEPAERALAVALLRLPEALDAVVADYRPNQLTAYLFDLANQYSTFYEQCPVLKAPDEATRASRLALCDLTARTIRQGLALLGIEVVEKM